jgi:hypothetical protein
LSPGFSVRLYGACLPAVVPFLIVFGFASIRRVLTAENLVKTGRLGPADDSGVIASCYGYSRAKQKVEALRVVLLERLHGGPP